MYFTFGRDLYSIIFMLKIDLWEVENENLHCPNVFPVSGVSTQVDCQAECLGRTSCIGITYNKYNNSTDNCHLCTSDSMMIDTTRFSFYKRPSNIFQICKNIL